MSRLKGKTRQFLNDVIRIWQADRIKLKKELTMEGNKIIFPTGYVFEWLELEKNEIDYFLRKLKLLNVPCKKIVPSLKIVKE